MALLPPLAAGNKFFYGSEFRVYKGAFDQVASPIASVPAADVTALADAIKKARAEVKAEKATDATTDALQKVYEKFLAISFAFAISSVTRAGSG